MMIIGGYIKFNLDYWTVNGEHKFKTIKTKIEGFIIDPLYRREKSILVSFNNESYGIPVSEIIEYSPPVGIQ